MSNTALPKNQPVVADFFVFLKPVLKPGDEYLWRIVPANKTSKGIPMKNKLNLAILSLSKINRQHVQLFFVVLTLAMLVTGVGAPEDGGGSTH